MCMVYFVIKGFHTLSFFYLIFHHFFVLIKGFPIHQNAKVRPLAKTVGMGSLAPTLTTKIAGVFL